MANILVVAELHDGHVRKSTHSAITFARQAGGTFSILLLGQGAKALAAEVAGYGAQKILVADDASLANPVAEAHAPTIAAVAKNGFDVIAVCASSYGKDVAPRVAAKLGAGYAPDISGVKDEGGKLVYRRPVFAGNAFATCSINTPVQVVSARQSEFSAAEPSGGSSPVEDVAVLLREGVRSDIGTLHPRGLTPGGGLKGCHASLPGAGSARPGSCARSPSTLRSAGPCRRSTLRYRNAAP